MECLPKFITYFNFEDTVPTMISTMNGLSVWSLKHNYFSCFITMILEYIWPLDIKDKYYEWMISLRSFAMFFIWEAFEYLASLGNVWWGESLHKKMFDMLQNSLGILVYILIRNIVGKCEFKSIKFYEKVLLIISGVAGFYLACFSSLFYVRNICLSHFKVDIDSLINNGFNTIPYGFWIYIFTMSILLYIVEIFAIHLFPENEENIRKFQFLNYIFFYTTMLPNVLWIFSSYITSWVTSTIIILIYWQKKDEVSIFINNYFSHQNNEINRDLMIMGRNNDIVNIKIL